LSPTLFGGKKMPRLNCYNHYSYSWLHGKCAADTFPVH